MPDWHHKVLPRPTKKALDFLSDQLWMKESEWYLAGGTALALQAGTRRSFDLDFFTGRMAFNEINLLTHFYDCSAWRTTLVEENTVYGELFKAKVSFLSYPSFIPKTLPLWHGTVRVLHSVDIAVMKIIAVSQRGRKRDFYDLYWCGQNLEPLEDTVRRLKVQYPTVAHDYHHILKSMVFFDDAESDPEPEIFFDANWKDIKKYFRKEIPALALRLIG